MTTTSARVPPQGGGLQARRVCSRRLAAHRSAPGHGVQAIQPACTPYTARRRRGGFSLAELVVALGILGVGMTMAAALFPAGLIGVQSCQDDINGTIICRNVQAVVQQNKAAIKAYLDDDESEALGQFVPVADSMDGSRIPYRQQCYPQQANDTDRTRSGFVLLGKRVDNDNDPTTHEGYQLLAVAYRKRSSGNLVVITTPLAATPDGSDANRLMDFADDYPWARGAMLIEETTGRYARVVDFDGTDALLSSPVSGNVFLVAELDASGSTIISSPGIAVLSFWTDFQ